MFSRRRFLTGSSLAAAGAVGFPHVIRSAEGQRGQTGRTPRRIIHMVADGMSMGTLTCADHFATLTRERGLTWMQLFNRPEASFGWMNMRSLNSLVTDSSAASSSWGSGSRINNAAVNHLPDGTSLTPLYELFGQQGWKRGLVTTTEITHATPAGFATSVEKRDQGEDIAKQYYERRIEVLAGGGHNHFKKDKRKDKRDLKHDFAKAGYVVCTNRDQLLSAPTDKPWLGLFADGHVPFTLDRNHSKKLQATLPTLAEMTRTVLNKLEREEHFILQVEGGRVDHACHNNDAAAALHDQIAFDEAIDAALGFQKRHPDTLIVITTDHGNSNLGLNGTGDRYQDSNQVFKNLGQITASFAEIKKGFKRKTKLPDPDKEGELKETEVAVSADEIAYIIEQTTGYKVPMEKAELLQAAISGRGSAMYDLMKSDTAQFGQLMANHTGISFTGTAHTADYVPITALGPGAENFRGFIQNTDVFRHYTRLAGIDFVNPTRPLMTGVGPEAGAAENIAEYA